MAYARSLGDSRLLYLLYLSQDNDAPGGRRKSDQTEDFDDVFGSDDAPPDASSEAGAGAEAIPSEAEAGVGEVGTEAGEAEGGVSSGDVGGAGGASAGQGEHYESEEEEEDIGFVIHAAAPAPALSEEVQGPSPAGSAGAGAGGVNAVDTEPTSRAEDIRSSGQLAATEALGLMNKVTPDIRKGVQPKRPLALAWC